MSSPLRLQQLSTDDLFGRFFLRIPKATSLQDYYRALEVSAPFLSTSSWTNAVTGYFLNIGPSHTLRISYFTGDQDSPARAVDSFLRQTGLEHGVQPERPAKKTISQGYGGEELRFRRFLSTYAPIGLQIMTAHLVHSRRLFAVFRLSVVPAHRPYRSHFERSFNSLSPLYRSLTSEEQERFWNDMQHHSGWAHMFVNMILGGDVLAYEWPSAPLSRHEINAFLRQNAWEFQIPDGWTPDGDEPPPDQEHRRA